MKCLPSALHEDPSSVGRKAAEKCIGHLPTHTRVRAAAPSPGTLQNLCLGLSSHPGTLQSVHTDWRPIYKKHKSDPVIQNPLAHFKYTSRLSRESLAPPASDTRSRSRSSNLRSSWGLWICWLLCAFRYSGGRESSPQRNPGPNVWNLRTFPHAVIKES